MDGASIITFVQAGLQVCNGLWSFYNTWKDYREDIAFICDSLADIEETLRFLQASTILKLRDILQETKSDLILLLAALQL